MTTVNRQLNERGQVMIITVLLLVLFSTSIATGLIAPTLRNIRTAENLQQSKQSLYVMESGVEDVIYRIQNAEPVGPIEVLSLGGGMSTTTITDLLGGKQITASGKSNSYLRKSAVSLTTDEGVAFHYALQVGNGGITLKNQAEIIGNVYSDGPIIGISAQSIITGSAISSGANGSITGPITIGNATSGIAYAHTITNTTANFELRCQSGSGNNKNCDTSHPDPATTTLPVTDIDIEFWKAEALAGGTYTGNYILDDVAGTLGPKRITGNVTLDNDAVLTVNGTLHIQGNLWLDDDAVVKLSSAYGNSVGVVVVDGSVRFDNDGTMTGNGQEGSYIFLIATGSSGVSIENGGGTVVINAQNSAVTFSNHSGARAVVAKQLILENFATITYDTGLIDLNFTSGPSGAWTVGNWRETE